MPPVIAVVGAYASITGGVAAIAAGSELVGGLMIAGGVASGLGAVTGNKTLSTFGAIASLGGGVAGLANGAWDSAATAAAQDSFGEPALAYDAGSMDAANNAALTNAGITGTTVGDPAAYDASAMDSDNNAALANAGVGSDASNGVVGSTMGSGGATDPTMAPQTNDASAPNAMTQQAAPGAQAAPQTSGVVGGAAKPNSPFGDFLQRVPKWIEQNKETAKIAGGLVGGAMKSYGDQSLLKQRYALQDAYEQTNRKRYSDSIKGLQMPSYLPFSATK